MLPIQQIAEYEHIAQAYNDSNHPCPNKQRMQLHSIFFTEIEDILAYARLLTQTAWALKQFHDRGHGSDEIQCGWEDTRGRTRVRAAQSREPRKISSEKYGGTDVRLN
jgi:hypothetical protein